MEQLYDQLSRLAQRHHARRLVLFGSRARGDGHERSDIDLAVYDMPERDRGAFWLEAEELPTLLKLDIVYISPGMSPAFLNAIEKEGVTLYASKDGKL
ncbi:MAG: nucleotidyltransferase domain-containing protein [Oscillospiraceae bacterium]|nr:nucleotidyltransferase domain-containing protein [Oscillospiraceae bacterium]